MDFIYREFKRSINKFEISTVKIIYFRYRNAANIFCQVWQEM